jgi:TPR repeat protein
VLTFDSALTAELEDFEERKRWLRMAAEEGHVAAMYYWGLVCDDPRQRERWLTEAARNGCEAAAAELCDD